MSLPDSPSLRRALVVTALALEYEAVRAHLLPFADPLLEVEHDGTLYEIGLLGEWEVVLVEIGTGGGRATRETQRALDRFKPDVAIFVGIAGGRKEVRIGDVVAAAKVYGYEGGKALAESTAARPQAWAADHALEQRARSVSRRGTWLGRLGDMESQFKASRKPRSFVGAIACGEKLVASTEADLAEYLGAHFNDALAVEMEGHGFCEALEAKKGVGGLVVRGISDLIDGKDADADVENQPRAARHAAAFAIEVLDKLKPRMLEARQRSLKKDKDSESVGSAELLGEDMVPATSLYLLHSPSGGVIATDNVFQDFDISRIRGRNPNAVQGMWTDTFANGSIRACVVTQPPERFLRIWFENGSRSEEQGERAKGWASNVAIRPQRVALNEDERGELKYRALGFSLRTPSDAKGVDEGGEVGLSLRILDRRLTFWVYTSLLLGKGPTQLPVTPAWRHFRIDLSPENYEIYTADGNRYYLRKNENGRPIPDFSIISGVTLVLGKYSAGREEPQSGRGVLDIKDIRLCD